MIQEDSLYSQVAEEIAQGKLDSGIWAKAIAHSEGSENLAKSLYVKFRITQMKEQVSLFESNLKNNQKVTCPHCGHYEEAETTSRGDTATCFILYLLFIVPGLIYTLMNSGYIYTCKKCKATLSSDKIKIY